LNELLRYIENFTILYLVVIAKQSLQFIEVLDQPLRQAWKRATQRSKPSGAWLRFHIPKNIVKQRKQKIIKWAKT